MTSGLLLDRYGLHMKIHLIYLRPFAFICGQIFRKDPAGSILRTKSADHDS